VTWNPSFGVLGVDEANGVISSSLDGSDVARNPCVSSSFLSGLEESGVLINTRLNQYQTCNMTHALETGARNGTGSVVPVQCVMGLTLVIKVMKFAAVFVMGTLRCCSCRGSGSCSCSCTV